MLHLNGVPLYGKQLHLSISKYSSVQMPREGSSEVCSVMCVFLCVVWYNDGALH